MVDMVDLRAVGIDIHTVSKGGINRVEHDIAVRHGGVEIKGIAYTVLVIKPAFEAIAGRDSRFSFRLINVGI